MYAYTLCDNRFLAWESTTVKTWGNSLAAGPVPESVTGNYLQRHQQYSELRSNDIVLIQGYNQNEPEHNQKVTKERNQRIFYKARLFKPETQF